MTDYEKEPVKKYPEAVAFVGVATSVWNGSNAPAKTGVQKLLFQKKCGGMIYIADRFYFQANGPF